MSPFLVWQTARQFSDAAQAESTRPKGTVDVWPTYYLCGHSIELALKCFLRGQHVPMEKLRKKYGHNLDRLLAKCTSSGLEEHVRLSFHEALNIERLNVHYLNKEVGYPSPGLKALPTTENVVLVAQKLVSGLRAYARATNLPVINAERAEKAEKAD